MAISLVSRRSGFQLGKVWKCYLGATATATAGRIYQLRFYLTIISPWCFAPRHHQQLLINNSTSYTPIPDTLDWENQTRFKLFPRIELKQKKKKRKLFVFSCPQCNFASREPGNPDRLPARVIIPARRDWEAEIERKRRMRTFLYYVEGEIWPKTNLRKERSRGTGMQMTSFPNRDQEPKGPDAHGNSFGGSVSGLGDPN
ncbi:uncharacterized protein FFB20_06008 [Fusarium fujikuroi]|nr:uncharacterized protein FFB20_06008 [Fusarium fujikuroi]SCN83169.1 uncharacterized protein FFC1_04143 [Fusarium fujikuroi]SCN83716.1 uncharacterized protein FFE2_05499 [Fusarium fujikuroi]SCO35325.1 uncharacterized protein FFNC_04359 [Fusarium fujikuroi]